MTVLDVNPLDIGLDYLDHPHDSNYLYFAKGELCVHLGRETGEIYLESENLIITDCDGLGPASRSGKCIFRATDTMIEMILKLHKIRRKVTLETRCDSGYQWLQCRIPGDRQYPDQYLFIRDGDFEILSGALMEMGALQVELVCNEEGAFPWAAPLLRRLSERFLVTSTPG